VPAKRRQSTKVNLPFQEIRLEFNQTLKPKSGNCAVITIISLAERKLHSCVLLIYGETEKTRARHFAPALRRRIAREPVDCLRRRDFDRRGKMVDNETGAVLLTFREKKLQKRGFSPGRQDKTRPC